MIVSFGLLILGLAFLIVGGDFLVKGASNIARGFGIPSLVVGLTIVSFGTSAPELMVSVKSALQGKPELALGNIVGSNIANLALILGVTGMLIVLKPSRKVMRMDYPFMLLVTLIFWFLAMSGSFSRLNGGVFVGLLVFYIGFLLWQGKNEGSKSDLKVETNTKYWLVNSMWLVLGLVGLHFGSGWLVDSAVDIATELGVEERVIGVTMIAFGTSVPELATSIIAVIKKETDIGLGNIIGSNIFNVLAVIGVTSIITPMDVSQKIVNYDMIWMVCITLFVFVYLLLRKAVDKPLGLLLLAAYGVYTYTLF